MTELRHKGQHLLKLSIICSFISSTPLLSCIFLEKNNESDVIIKIVFPIVFWIGLLAEQFFFWKSNSIRKDILKSGKFRKLKSNIGLISMLQNEYGAVADIVFVISLVVLLVLMIIGIGEKTAQYVLIFLLVLSFRLHCILNGKNFKYINYSLKRQVKKDV